MNALKDTYIIVKPHNSAYDFFQNSISFDKAELEAKCKEMNTEANTVWREKHAKSKVKNKKPWTDLAIFEVMDLESASEKLRDMVYDATVVEDESI